LNRPLQYSAHAYFFPEFQAMKIIVWRAATRHAMLRAKSKYLFLLAFFVFRPRNCILKGKVHQELVASAGAEG
jgi:hypothetical protein